MANDAKDNRTQLERFKEAAKQVRTDDSEERFDRVLKKVAKKAADRTILKRDELTPDAFSVSHIERLGQTKKPPRP